MTEQDELPPMMTSRHSSQSSNISQHSNPASSPRSATSGVCLSSEPQIPSSVSAASSESSDSDTFARMSEILNNSLKKIQDHFDQRVSNVEEKVDKLETGLEARLETNKNTILHSINTAFNKHLRNPTSRGSSQSRSSQSATPGLQSASGLLHNSVSETVSPSSLGGSSSADNPGDSPLLNASRGDSSKTPFSNGESPCSQDTYLSVTPEEESSRSGYENVRLWCDY